MYLANRIASIIVFVYGIYIIIEALKFDYMISGTPGPGFLPLWIGLGISILSIILFIKSFTKFKSQLLNPFESGDLKTFLVVIGGSVIVAVITPLTGLLIALGVMVGVVTKLLGTQSWEKVFSLGILTPLLLFIIFDVILGVPLPKSIFGF